MNFSSAVIISLLFYNLAVSSEGSFLSETISMDGDDMLTEFFALYKLKLESLHPWHVTVIGTSNIQFHKIKLLLEAFPSFIGSEVTDICASQQYTAKTTMLHFLDSLEEGYITEVVRNLGNCKSRRLYFIFEGFVVSDSDIDMVLRVASEKIARLPVFIHHSEKFVRFYGYEVIADCSRRTVLLLDWIPGVDLKGLDDFNSGVMNNDCPVFIATMHQIPRMNLAKDANGTRKIIAGFEGDLISTIAEKMDFIPHIQEFRTSKNDRGRTMSRAASSCAAGKSAFCIGRIRPGKNLMKAVDISQSYTQDCLVWCVPRITREKSDVITSEFSWSTWLLIVLTFLVSFTVERIVRNTNQLNGGNVDRSGCCSIILDLMGSTLGNPIIYQPLSIGGKCMLIMYLCYSTVITTAYKTSLSSILMVEDLESSIVDVEGIIKANLTTGGGVFELAILNDQRGENKLIPELIKRFVIEPNISKALRRVSNDKDFAYLIALTDLIYHKHFLARFGEPVSVDFLDECVLTHGSVIAFPKSSHLAERIDVITARLAQGGLVDYWVKKYSKWDWPDFNWRQSSDKMNTEKALHGLTRNKFYRIFVVYCTALTFCIFVFFGELLAHKLKFRGRVRQIRNSNRVEVRRRMRLQPTTRPSN